ncbi:zinc finger protein 543-like [Spodoptera frugiperda]|uniref:Zinc finger protein 543-like n=1 Tax=Spodoptera frugiperda TaxID=7108 RepID=A0A9R0E6C6_SPOFR|nr:zinc finger protein 543-like [Spodoptera frugiperda]
MSANNRKGPIVDPGVCRCCGAIRKCRLLNVEYEWSGQREVYADMFVDCFGLVLSHLEGEEAERLICATCVVRLRDARAFRQQVLLCEEKLLSANVQIHDDDEDRMKMDVEVKQELDMSHDDVSVTNDDHHDPIDDSTVPQNKDREATATALSIQVKIEDMHEETVMPLSPVPLEGASDEQAKTDMLDKLNHMKKKLDELQQSEPRPTYQAYRQPNTVDKDLHILRNIVKIVENSYVCPFLTVFSDYHCVYCKEMFVDPIELRKHTLSHDPKTYRDVVDNKKLIQLDIGKIDCRLCDEKIDTIDSLKDHITSVHNKKFYTDVSNEFLQFKLKIGTLTCVECGKKFGFFHALRKHMAVHFGTYICDVCGAHYFEERHLIFHKNSHNKKDVKMFHCNECDKTFRSKYSRNFHVARIHKNEPAYPCNKCEEVFISYHMRYRHKMNVHGEKRQFPCDGCDKVFDSRKTLREHNQRTHLQLLRHQCTFCDKKFYLPSALRDHMTSHTGERNFRCEFCGKNYPRSKALKVHLQSHSAEKKYKCCLCPSAYTQVTNYRNHMRTKHPGNDYD